ncbi:MAG: hypothetical protein IKU09_07090 [Firmicutes bacterium]|nr:hypothetical protein [Bacillota bacterium]
MRIRLEMEILLDELKKRLENCETELAACPEGELYQVRRGGKTEFYRAVKGSDHHRVRNSLRSEPEVAAALARKVYLKEECRRLKDDISFIQQIMKRRPEKSSENILADLPARFKDLPKEWLLGSQNMAGVSAADRWAAEPYRQSDYRPEEKTKITSRGLHVRSMAEVVCCERYYHHDVPFRYEAALEIGEYTFAPDITAMRRRDGKIFYHEHCGLPRVPEYWRKHKWKLELYEKAGIVPWDNLIVTYGDRNGNVDVREIEAAIVNRLI